MRNHLADCTVYAWNFINARMEDCENLTTVYIASSKGLNDDSDSNLRGRLVYYYLDPDCSCENLTTFH